MTKRELIRFLEPFDDNIIIIDMFGEDGVAKYLMDDDGEGMIVISSEYER